MANRLTKLLVFFIVTAVFILGMIGYRRLSVSKNGSCGAISAPMPIPDAAYRSLQLFVFNRDDPPGPKPIPLQIARFSAPLALALTGWQLILMARWRQRNFFLLPRFFWKNHLIVCGLGRKGAAVAENAIKRKLHVIAIEQSGDSVHGASLRRLGVPVVIGDASERLATTGIKRAKAVFISCGKDDDNVRVALQAAKLALSSNRTSPLTVTPHLIDAEVRSSLRDHIGQLMKKVAGAAIDLNDVSQGELAARTLFVAHPLDHKPIVPSSDRYPRLILIGFGRTGQAIFRQALKIAHYPNGKLLEVDIFDAQAGRLWSHFVGRTPSFATTLPPIANVRWFEGNVLSTSQMQNIGSLVTDPLADVTIVICLDCDSESVLVADHLPIVVSQKAIPVLVRMHGTGGISELIEERRTKSFPAEPPKLKIRAFGQITRTFTLAAVLGNDRDKVAQAIHEQYLESYRPTDPADWKRQHLPWNELDESFRDSNRQAADFIPVLLRSFGYKLAEPTEVGDSAPVTELTLSELLSMAETEHARWYAERYLAGWTRALNRDDTKLEHDCMVRWADLTPAQQQKDISQI